MSGDALGQSVFINEIHYDNVGGDIGEGIEIAGPAGTDLTCYEIYLYNGGNSLIYAPGNPFNLSGNIDDEGCGFGAVWFAITGIQNGAPDAIALVDTCGCVGPCDNDDVVQFISYEGTLTAGNGPANTMLSVDIGVDEQPAPAIGTSIQLTGAGNTYSDFTWLNPSTSSEDAINNGQNFCPVSATQLTFTSIGSGCTLTDSIFSVTVCGTDSVENVDITYSGTITISIATGPGNLTGTLSVVAVAGCATFSDLAIDSASQYTLIASDGSLINDTTNNIAVVDSCGKCFEIQSILVEACEPGPGLEGENEMVRFQVGPADLDAGDIFVDWPNNSWLGLCQDTITQGIIDSINLTITGGGMVYAPSNGVLPAGAIVILVTSTNFDWATHDWSALNYDLYMIFQCPGNSSGHFKNNQGCPCGTRELIIDFNGFCSDSVTYSPDSLTGFDGDGVDFDPPGNASYGNNGCKPPIFPFSVFLSTISTNISCNALCDGTATATPSGGAPPFTYSWDTSPVQTDSVATGLCPGTYTVTITDAALTVITGSEVITEPDTLQIAFGSIFNVGCNGDSSGSVTASTTGGTTPYTFSWNDPSSQTDSTAIGLAQGTYTVTVTDANACSDTDSVTINEPSVLAISLSGSTDVLCFGDSTGLATGIASGGTSPYTYLWNDPSSQTDTIATGLAAGTYTIVSTDNNGCQDSVSVVITESAPIFLSISLISNILCNEDSTASINVSSVGGISPYTYLWNDPGSQTDSTATGLAAGVYSVIVTDGVGCTATDSITVAEPPAIIISTTSTAATCGISDGTANGSVLGGTMPYTYSWNTSPVQTDSAATGLAAGSYTLIVVDGNACLDSAIANISNVGGPSVSISDSTNITCNGDSTGYATVSTIGGTPPLTYLWNDPLAQTDSTATGLKAGTFTVTVTDAGNCLSIISVTLTEPAGMLITTSFIPVLCNGGSTAAAIVSVSGGAAPYTYLWDDLNTQTNANATGLPVGSYTVIVSDTNSCSGTGTVTVSEPNALSISMIAINAGCTGDSTGSATASVSGGTAPYSYLWNDPGIQTDSIATGLNAGSYIVSVSDANGCPILDTVTIGEPAAMILVMGQSDANCGLATGSTWVTTTGGTGPYNYLWSDLLSQSNDTATGLAAGPYTVTVTDANGCMSSNSAVVGTGSGLTAAIMTFPSNCSVASGSINVMSVSGGTPPYTYVWDDPNTQTTSAANGLGAGTFTVTITDAVGCSIMESRTITGGIAGPVIDNITITNESCIDADDGTVTITTSGGVTPYTYVWGNPVFTSTSTSQNIPPGNYYVIIMDAQGCGTADSVFITASPDACPDSTLFIPTSFSPNGDGTNDTWFRDAVDYPNILVEIFNRWGSLVHSSEKDGLMWDGKYKGKDVAMGTYYFIIILDDGLEPITGNVTIVR